MQNFKKMSKNQQTIIIGFFLVLIILSSILSFSVSVFLMQFFLAMITIPLILKKEYKIAKLYLIIFMVSLVFVFLVYYGNQFYYGNPYYIGGSDDLKFENWGYDVYDANLFLPHKVIKQQILDRFNNAPFYAVIIAIIVKFSNGLAGYTSFLPRILNVYFLIWICMILEYLVNKYANIPRDKLLFVIGGFALMPNIQYINSHVFRDTFNLLQVFLIVFLFDKIIDSKNLLTKFISLLFMTVLIYFTYYTRVNSLAFAAILSLLILIEKYKIKIRYVILLFILLILMSDILKILKIEYFITTYTRYVANIAGDGLSRFIFGRPLLPFGIILRFVYSFIIPFPNFFGLFKESSRLLYDFVYLLIYLGVLVQILMTPFIIKRIFRFDWLSFSFLGCLLPVIAMTFTFRHVILYYPFMVAMAVDGYFSTKLNNRKMIMFLWGIIAFCLSLIYVVLKFL